MRKFFGLICLCTILFLCAGGSVLKAEEKDSGTTQFKQITFIDCGIENGSYSEVTGGTASQITSMDKVQMRGKVSLVNGWANPGIYVGGSRLVFFYYNGSVHFMDASDNTYLVSVDRISGNELEFCVTFEYVNDRDAKVTFSFDDTEYYSGVVQGLVDTLEPTMTISTWPNAVSVESVWENVYDVASYRGGDVYRSPKKEGKVFAGWYTDETCAEPLGQDVTTGKWYAKFVDEDVLSVKAQVIAGTEATDKKTDIRFVSTVDSLEYQEVGFEVVIEGRKKQFVPLLMVYE